MDRSHAHAALPPLKIFASLLGGVHMFVTRKASATSRHWGKGMRWTGLPLWLFPGQTSKILLLFTAVVSLGACAQALTAAPGYTVSEIPYIGSRFAWIDNQSVLFIGARSYEYGRSSGPPALYRWNTQTGEVVGLMKTGSYADLCYDRGYLYVAFNRGEDRVIRQGPMGREKEFVFRRRGESPFKGFFNRYNCRFREVPPATQPNRGVVTVLRDDHGFIEAERPSEPFPQRKYFLVRPSGDRIEIDLPCGAGGPRFSEFRKAYIYQDGSSLSGRNVERRVCVVGVDGAVENYKLPKGEWMRGTVYGMPVQDGILMVSLSTLAKAEGAYLVKGAQVQRVVKGYTIDFAISPDGCQVAMLINPDIDRRAVSRNAVLNVCKGGN